MMGIVKSYPMGTGMIAGRNYTLAALTQQEVQEIYDHLTYMINDMHPTIQAHIMSNFEMIVNLIRAVKYETKQDFKGDKATSNELTLIMLDELAFGADLPGNTFVKNISTPGWANLIASSASPRTCDQYTAEIILGFVDPVETPKVSRISIVKDGITFAHHSIPLRYSDVDYKVPTHLLNNPWTIPPQSSYYARAYYPSTGVDILTPIGFKVVRASTVMST